MGTGCDATGIHLKETIHCLPSTSTPVIAESCPRLTDTPKGPRKLPGGPGPGFGVLDTASAEPQI